MRLSRAELFWLAYLWWVNDCAEREARAFARALFDAYDSARLHELALRASPLLQKISRR